MDNLIETKVREIIKENAELIVPIEEIGLDDDITNIGINSISFIKVVVAAETEFEFEFEDDDLDFSGFKDIRSIIAYIENKTKG